MPKALAYHCAILYNDKVIIHGGLQWPKQPNMDTFIFDLSYNQWTTVPNKIPCGAPPVFDTTHSKHLDKIPQPFYRTTCEMWQNHLIVASFDFANNASCTAALDLRDFQWHMVKDLRQPVLHGTLIK